MERHDVDVAVGGYRKYPISHSGQSSYVFPVHRAHSGAHDSQVTPSPVKESKYPSTQSHSPGFNVEAFVSRHEVH